MALGSDSVPQLDHEREFGPGAALMRIPALSSDSVYFD
jgi:hypothetical protein